MLLVLWSLHPVIQGRCTFQDYDPEKKQPCLHASFLLNIVLEAAELTWPFPLCPTMLPGIAKNRFQGSVVYVKRDHRHSVALQHALSTSGVVWF